MKELLGIARSYTLLMELAHDAIADLDVLVSLAHVAAAANYIRPHISPAGEGDIVLRGARHPCLELSPDITFIPNDVNLLRESARFQIITGPNMGGKSTYIRMVSVFLDMFVCVYVFECA